MGLLDFNLADVGSLFTSAREAITGKRILDPNEQAKVDLQLAQLEQALKTGQIEINKIEAAHKSLFVAGWRPAIGWVAAISLFLMYVPKALVMTGIWTIQCYEILDHATEMSAVSLPNFPELGTADIIGLVVSMLGMAGFRTFEKKIGVAREK